MLVTLTDVLKDSKEKGYAVPAFNVFGYEDAKACILAAEELNAPVILATNKVAISHMPITILGSILTQLAESSSVPVVVHLDHGKDFQTVAQALKAGYSSIMYDGSQLSLDENIKTTREVVKLAHALGVPVEAEIGAVGYSDPNLGVRAILTNPEEAKVFAEGTGVDALAVAVGTLHRMEEQSAEIRYDLINEIETLVSVPLVMHGSTGIPDEDLKKIAKTNFGKVNIGTALRMKFGHSLREQLDKNHDVYDRIELFGKAMDEVKEEAIQKMRLLNTQNYQPNTLVLN
ncbi:class II fructose-bisphosphate aldolase [Alkalihalophilus lindianensis]|uniref:Class II fructose-bisphosphate aldolase n=1 Tax=Alkalihalophilus lindianensis TaxID=1630542 RepID=A0ABU3X5J9_9BACI|nr:class II fructose-bisphosphate aldolase [Alkalihalophilus lindianensis]MDV2682892.1 class II fructose-bisphosphate aldolase [Alkalihalophilus lindianensis]